MSRHSRCLQGNVFAYFCLSLSLPINHTVYRLDGCLAGGLVEELLLCHVHYVYVKLKQYIIINRPTATNLQTARSWLSRELQLGEYA